jgi:hypothetical protein
MDVTDGSPCEMTLQMSSIRPGFSDPLVIIPAFLDSTRKSTIQYPQNLEHVHAFRSNWTFSSMI